MTLVTSLRLTFASLALFSSLAAAETRFCLGGDLQTMSEAEQAGCRSQLQALRQGANALPQNGNWHIVLVCGEQAWQEYQNFTGEPNARLAAAQYDVSLDSHEIFLRSARIPARDVVQTSALLRQIATTEKKVSSQAIGE